LGIIDFTNDLARAWMKNLMNTNLLADTGIGGWMHDFGFLLPYDA
jgi:alpha-glucosidase (family GH31 glycosyl hydrolase)